MESRTISQFIRFLQEDLAIPTANIQLALQHPEENSVFLPIILRQYGLITLNQLNSIFDWLEQNILTQ